MENFKKRTILALSLSAIFYLIWILYDICVYLDINNKNLFVLTILGIFVSIPFFLFSMFFIKNEYKHLSDKVNSYIVQYFWLHIFAAFITVMTSIVSSLGILIISLAIKGVIIFITFRTANKIYTITVELEDTEEEKKVNITYGEVIVCGVSALILSGIMLGIIFLGGKSIYTLLIISPFLILIIACNYTKYNIVSKFNIIDFKKAVIVDNVFVIVSSVISFFLSNSTMFIRNASQRGFHISIFFIIPFFMLIPLIKTNKEIGANYNK